MLKTIDYPVKLLADVVLLIAREVPSEPVPTLAVRSRPPTWQFPT
jgi:hypothetical protein